MKKLLLVSALIACAFKSQAQFDLFGDARTVSVSLTTTNIFGTGSAALSGGNGGGNWTNAPVDLVLMEGIVKADLIVITNAATTPVTVQLMFSNDKTNFWNATNYAIGNPTYFIFTNTYYSGGLGLANWAKATNLYMLPGTNTIPTSATAGYATPYLIPAPFTNAAAITVGNLPITVAWNRSDAGRYFLFYVTTAGASTNLSIGGTITGKQRPYYVP